MALALGGSLPFALFDVTHHANAEWDKCASAQMEDWFQMILNKIEVKSADDYIRPQGFSRDSRFHGRPTAPER